MNDIKNELNLYRKRACKIENENIEIENLVIKGVKCDDERIKKIKLEIKQMELENKKIDNILKLLPNKHYEVVRRIYLEGKEKRKVAKELDRTERQINYSINKALKRISKDFMD